MSVPATLSPDPKSLDQITKATGLGAFVIGGVSQGGGDQWGQSLNESFVKSLWELPTITVTNMLEVLAEALRKLPLAALQQFQALFPTLDGINWSDPESAINGILSQIIPKPIMQSIQDFEDWVNNTFKPLFDLVNAMLAPFQALLGGTGTGSDVITSGLTNLFGLFSGSTNLTGASSVMTGLFGNVNTQGTALNQLGDLFNGNMFVTPINAAVQMVKDWLGGTNTKLGAINPDGSFAGTVGIGQVPDLSTFVDAAHNVFSGAVAAGEEVVNVGVTQAKTTLENFFGQFTGVVRGLQSIQSQQTAAANSGQHYDIDFSQYPDGAFPSGLFNLSYSGAGSSRLAISSGHAGWSTVNNGYVRATMLYPQPTLTPFQIVKGTMSSPPQQGTNVRIWAVARANAAGTDYVFARGYCTGYLTYRGDIGCVVGGVEKVWASNIPLKWSLDMQLHCGVSGDPRRHRVVSGTSIVWEGVEPSDKQSVVDANHCYWGAISETDGSHIPGAVAGTSVLDNALPSVVGTTGRVYRASSSAASIGIANGSSVCVNNFFDTIQRLSADLSYEPNSNCGFRVNTPGTYLVTLRATGTGTVPQGCGGFAGVYKNGTPYAWGGYMENPTTFNVTSTVEDAVFYTGSVYANAGDLIQPGFWMKNFSSAVTGVGDLTGSLTYFEVTKLG